MAGLIESLRKRFSNGDQIRGKIWKTDGDPPQFAISLVYLAREGGRLVRIYGIDNAHGPLHEHHGEKVCALSMREGEILPHFQRISQVLQRARLAA